MWGGGGDERGSRQTFFRRTRRGRVQQVVRERYLRDDVGFGTLAARGDLRDEEALAEVLNDEHRDKKSGMRELLVLDTNVVLHQMDLLEVEDCAPLQNAVLLETVLQETKKNNLSVYNRLALLLRDDKRCFVAFANEHHRDTWREQLAGETPNDYNDRLIREATAWFKQQVEGEGIARVVLVTNDRKNRDLARKAGLHAVTIHAYVKSVKASHPDLIELLAGKEDDGASDVDTDGLSTISGARSGARAARFAAHLSEPEINRRLKAGTVVQGTFRSSPYARDEGTIMAYSADGQATKIVIKGHAHMNRAVEGDRVAVVRLSASEAAAPGGVAAAEDEDAEDAEDGEVGAGLADEVAEEPGEASVVGTKLPSSAATASAPASQNYGKVVGIIKRNWRQYCGSVDERDATRIIKGEHVLVVPVDPKLPKIRIRTRQLEAIKDKRILVSIDAWDRYSAFPDGHFVKVIGTIGDRETETAVLLHEHDIPTLEFSRKVMKCLPSEGASWKVTPENSQGRTDLRHLPVCSIDPPGCKDIDDALHVRHLENGNLEVGVHIADVTHFVRHDSEIDKEAANRGTSTYLVERRLDMLPGLLTTDICSLRGGVDRFAFSVIWELTPPQDDETEEPAKKKRKTGASSKKSRNKRSGEDADDSGAMDVSEDGSEEDSDDGRGLKQISVRFCKSIIHSKAALSYGEAQAWLDDPNAVGELPDNVRMLNRIARVLRQRRIDAGALSLASQEVRFKLDNDSHDPTDVEMYQQKEANSLVEEFMLLANITVAKRIVERYPRCSMLRRHPAPAKEMFDELLRAAKIHNVNLRVDSSKALADSLDAAVRPGKPFFNKLFRILTTRCMMQAVYFISGDFAPPEYRHYGLASPIYTHFTSPIRRYADVVVHRLLAAAENIDPLPVPYESKDSMKDLCDNLNKRHHNAQLAGRASIALHTVVFFRGRTTVATAMVSRVRERGIVVVVPEYGIEGKIAFAKSDAEAKKAFDYDSDQMLTRHKATGHTIQVFDEVKVKLYVHRSAAYRETLIVTLVKPGIPCLEPGATMDDKAVAVADAQK